MAEKAGIYKYNNNYAVLMPVYYEHESRPAWRKYFIGTRTECENVLKSAPDYLKATAAENAENRHYKRLEYLLLIKLGQIKKADAIKAQYNL